MDSLNRAADSVVGSAAARITSFADIRSAFVASQDMTGFGSATPTRTLTVTDETDTLSVPCTIHLTNGAHLTIRNSTVTTSKLIVADDWSGARTFHTLS